MLTETDMSSKVNIGKKLNSADFEKAIRERNFNEMSDIYNEMMHHEITEFISVTALTIVWL